MEPIFECHVPDNRIYANDMIRFKLFSYPVSKVSLIATAGISAVMLIASIVPAAYGSPYYLILSLSLIAAIAVFWICACKVSVNAAKKQMEELSGGNVPEVRFSFTEDRMIMAHANGGVSEVSYDSFKRIFVKKNVIFAESGAKLLYCLPKDAFVKGTSADLIDFLSRKGIKII